MRVCAAVAWRIIEDLAVYAANEASAGVDGYDAWPLQHAPGEELAIQAIPLRR